MSYILLIPLFEDEELLLLTENKYIPARAIGVKDSEIHILRPCGKIRIFKIGEICIYNRYTYFNGLQQKITVWSNLDIYSFKLNHGRL